MTEESYQQARKLMQQANYLRGKITSSKEDVARWTNLEHWYIQEKKELNAKAARRNLDKALAVLDERKARFAAMKFPESDLPESKKEKRECEMCGIHVDEGVGYCNGCLYNKI